MIKNICIDSGEFLSKGNAGMRMSLRDNFKNYNEVNFNRLFVKVPEFSEALIRMALPFSSTIVSNAIWH